MYGLQQKKKKMKKFFYFNYRILPQIEKTKKIIFKNEKIKKLNMINLFVFFFGYVPSKFCSFFVCSSDKIIPKN